MTIGRPPTKKGSRPRTGPQTNPFGPADIRRCPIGAALLLRYHPFQRIQKMEEAMTLVLGIPVEFLTRKPGLACLAVALLISAPAAAQSPKVGDPPEASNMRLVGFNDLQGRSAYQPTIHHQGNRWIAYIGHHGGTDDVLKPVNPITGQAE